MSNQDIATVIRSLRDLRGLSRRALARAVDCSDNTVRNIETGAHSPSIQLVRRLLDALDADEATRSALLAPSQ